MSWEPLRFLHAAGVWLDHPPSGTGPLPEELRRLTEDATLTAFDRLIDVAIERQVDFVLLAGDSFDEGDGSLRAQVALLDGLTRLGEQHIRVFVLPGQADPPLAWRTLGALPDNVSCLLARDDEPVAVIRGSQLVATVARAEPANAASLPAADAFTTRGETARSLPFAVGLCSSDALCGHGGDPDRRLLDLPFDYLALGGSGRRQTFRTRRGLAHHPGPLQALSRHHPGQHGFTIVEIDAAGSVHKQFVLAAPLRWERFELPLDPQCSRHALLNAMRRELAAVRAEPGEQLWLIEWQIAGSGPLVRALEDESFQSELWAELDSEPTGINIPVRHSLRLLPGARQPVMRPDVDDSPLNFSRFAGELPASTAAEMAAALRLDGVDPAWQSRLGALVPHLAPQAVDAEAARLGALLFDA